MKRFGIDRLIEDILSGEEAVMRLQFDRDGRHGVSPIESIMGIGLRHRLESLSRPMFSFAYFTDDEFWVEPDNYQIHFGAQIKLIGNWPVDFVLLVSMNNKTFRAAIECDGHEYHERTKEQAKRDRSRDRELQKLGYRVFRFTGSEIYNDPSKCVDEVADAFNEFVEAVDSAAIDEAFNGN